MRWLGALSGCRAGLLQSAGCLPLTESAKDIPGGRLVTTLKTKIIEQAAAGVLMAALVTAAVAEELGSVDTKWRALSPDDTINVEVFDDEKIQGIACYLSRAETGGYKGALGMAEDTSHASLDCHQVGPIRIREPLDKGESVFRQRRSLIFKSMKVLRYCDTKRNVIVYLVYSEKVIEGSPQNSVSAVPITHWGSGEPTAGLARCVYAG
jgi:CreA protein